MMVPDGTKAAVRQPVTRKAYQTPALRQFARSEAIRGCERTVTTLEAEYRRQRRAITPNPFTDGWRTFSPDGMSQISVPDAYVRDVIEARPSIRKSRDALLVSYAQWLQTQVLQGVR